MKPLFDETVLNSILSTNFDRLMFALKADRHKNTSFLNLFNRVSVFGLHVLFWDPNSNKFEMATFHPTISSIYLVCSVSRTKS